MTKLQEDALKNILDSIINNIRNGADINIDAAITVIKAIMENNVVRIPVYTNTPPTIIEPYYTRHDTGGYHESYPQITCDDYKSTVSVDPSILNHTTTVVNKMICEKNITKPVEWEDNEF